MITTTLILFIIYSYLEGVREADYFHFRWKHENEVVADEHLKFTLQRTVVAILGAISSTILWGWFGLLFIPCAALVFTFIHDGSYYKRRNTLDSTVYKKKWYDQTSSSSAKISLTPVIRTVLFILGVSSSIVIDLLLFLL